ncbi:hypothetical protein H4Q26_004785 [Puccinia striiformis f. sp. tritici PST-130]|nr:hypothetical protein H4Q26_004785 [Puccinia striiformis f. sp. tritici PST-130]
MQGVSLARKLTSTMKDPLKPGMSGITKILWTDPDLDIFGAIGNDYQFECYDLINLTREDKGWDEFNPISNLIWLHYLTKKLIDEKSIAKPPSRTTSSAPTRTITKTAQKERRQTSSSTRARRRQQLLIKRSENHKNEEEKEQKLKIERDCYELLILSQRFLDHVIQHKVQLIHQRAKHRPTRTIRRVGQALMDLVLKKIKKEMRD